MLPLIPAREFTDAGGKEEMANPDVGPSIYGAGAKWGGQDGKTERRGITQDAGKVPAL